MGHPVRRLTGRATARGPGGLTHRSGMRPGRAHEVILGAGRVGSDQDGCCRAEAVGSQVAIGPTDHLAPSLPVASWGAVQLSRETRDPRAHEGDPPGTACALVGRISPSMGAPHMPFLPSQPSSVCGIDYAGAYWTDALRPSAALCGK